MFQSASITSSASMKNRIEQSQLTAKLSRLDREKRNEMRMCNHEKRQFLQKFSKKMPYESKYLTSEPAVDKNLPTQFQCVDALVFTNGAVDIEKIACLHFLSVHPIEKLSLPIKNLKQSIMKLPKKKCTRHLQFLLDESKNRLKNFEFNLTKLPLYTICISTNNQIVQKPSDDLEVLSDAHILSSRILVNVKFADIVCTVLNALDQSNRGKLQKLVAKMSSANFAKEILMKRSLGKFFGSLQNNPILTNLDSYALTSQYIYSPIDIHIKKTPSGILEKCLKSLYPNILQAPKIIWDNSEPEDLNNKSQIITKRMSKTGNTGPSQEKFFRRSLPRASLSPSDGGEKSLVHVTTNFIAKNIEAAANYRKFEYDENEENELRPRRNSTDSDRSRRRSSTSSNVVKVQQKSLIHEGHEEDSDKDYDYEDEDEIADFLSLKKKRRSSSDSEDTKYHLKQTTCPACMEKWKTPLPAPKTPRVKRLVPTATDVEGLDLIANSQNRVSMLINKEMYKFDSYDRRFSNDSSSGSRRSSVVKTPDVALIIGGVDKNAVDLAKIEQEIKQGETQKKLENIYKFNSILICLTSFQKPQRHEVSNNSTDLYHNCQSYRSVNKIPLLSRFSCIFYNQKHIFGFYATPCNPTNKLRFYPTSKNCRFDQNERTSSRRRDRRRHRNDAARFGKTGRSQTEGEISSGSCRRCAGPGHRRSFRFPSKTARQRPEVFRFGRLSNGQAENWRHKQTEVAGVGRSICDRRRDSNARIGASTENIDRPIVKVLVEC